MKTLHFSVRIHCAPETAWNTMIDDTMYRDWTSAFMEGSYYEGSWRQGEKIRFLTPGGDGMSSVVAEARPYEFLSIRHIGEMKGGVEDTESPEVKKWSPSYENYTFTPHEGGSQTEVRIDMDVQPEYEKYMTQAWPKALARLKVLCENERT